jgi:hypothetical protein
MFACCCEICPSAVGRSSAALATRHAGVDGVGAAVGRRELVESLAYASGRAIDSGYRYVWLVVVTVLLVVVEAGTIDGVGGWWSRVAPVRAVRAYTC